MALIPNAKKCVVFSILERNFTFLWKFLPNLNICQVVINFIPET